MQTSMSLPIALPLPMATGSLDGYIQTVNRFPILSAEEEKALAERYSTRNDLEAAHKIRKEHEGPLKDTHHDEFSLTIIL